ncbi:MAG TPA: 5-formyltetrahydrofolate cyclo-ligase [Candidatus Acidoferrales bacterium]|nr:5-formyltetrahydrofolate cyclo-ligase [Candidatus Acidoferrales bacterium]
MVSKNVLRMKVWKKLREVAAPDSRFHLDFSMYIPDFEGSDACVTRIRELDLWKQSAVNFVTPDNCLTDLRKTGLLDNKTQIMTTYGIKGGFLIWTRDDVPVGQEDFASTLDGAQKYAKPITLEEIIKFRHLDLVITGASAVNLEGVRYGKGHGYFDLEWGMLSAIGVIDAKTVMLTVVHDCQVVDKKFPVSPYDTITDFIITPTRTIKISTQKEKPKGIRWRSLQKQMLKEIPPLAELKHMQKLDQT